MAFKHPYMCLKGDLNVIKVAEIYQYIYIMLKDGL